MKFVEFAGKMGVELTGGQEAFCRVSFDGEEPAAVPDRLQPYVTRLFGGVVKYGEMERRVVTVVAGARSGKTYLSALRALHLAVTLPLERLRPGEEGFVLLIGPSKSHARQMLRYARGAASTVTAFERNIVGESEDHFTVARGKRRVNVQCVAATAGGESVRGKTLLGLFMDEAAFFRDDKYLVNDRAIFDAGTPRVVKGGQTVVSSTPWAEAGLVYERWQEHFGKRGGALVAHASTETMREGGPDWDTVRWEIEQARKSDEDNARREFDAEFMAGGSGLYFDGGAIDVAVRDHEVIRGPAFDTQIVAGADFGFKHDSSALVIVQRKGRIAHVSKVVEVKPEKGKPLAPSAVVDQFAWHLKEYGLKTVMSDGHYREAIAEHLDSHRLGLVAAPEGQIGKTQVYARAKQAFHDGAVVLPANDRLRRQLKEIVAKPTAGGGMSIQSPRWKSGGHGDLVSALVLALYQLHGVTRPELKREPWSTTHLRERAKQVEARRKAEEAFGIRRPSWN